MPVDQTDAAAIAQVITELRQRVLDGGPPFVGEGGATPEGIDSAALRLAALCLFDIGLAMTQDQYGEVQEATAISTLEHLIGRECPHCHNGVRLLPNSDNDDDGFAHLTDDGPWEVCHASPEAVRMLRDLRAKDLTPETHASSEE